jgi:hypothetical protein
VPLEGVAIEARRLGFGWGKSSVAAIEAGRRALSLEELIALPHVLGRAGVWAHERAPFTNPSGTTEDVIAARRPVAVPDLLPDDERSIRLASAAVVAARALRTRFAASGWHQIIESRALLEEETEMTLAGLPPAWVRRGFEKIRQRDAHARPPREWDAARRAELFRQVGLDAAGDAVRKAASVLRADPLAVALAGHALWGWGLVAEREHRLAGSLLLAVNPDVRFTDRAQLEHDWGLSDDEKTILARWHIRGGQERALPQPVRRKLQAARGHLTRALLDEVRPLLEGAAGKKPRAAPPTRRRNRR